MKKSVMGSKFSLSFAAPDCRSDQRCSLRQMAMAVAEIQQRFGDGYRHADVLLEPMRFGNIAFMKATAPVREICDGRPYAPAPGNP